MQAGKHRGRRGRGADSAHQQALFVRGRQAPGRRVDRRHLVSETAQCGDDLRRARTPVGYLGAFITNSVRRKSLGAWLERVVFSTPGAKLPFGTQDFRTRQVDLIEGNFELALQASCSIPFIRFMMTSGLPTASSSWDHPHALP